MSYRPATKADIGRVVRYQLSADKQKVFGLLKEVEGVYAIVKPKHGFSVCRPKLDLVEVAE